MQLVMGLSGLERVVTNMGVALTWSDGTGGGGPAVVNVAGDRAV